LTTYNLDKVIEGDIADTIEALRVAENANKLQAGQE
jgi:protein subunit release factor A